MKLFHFSFLWDNLGRLNPDPDSQSGSGLPIRIRTPSPDPLAHSDPDPKHWWEMRKRWITLQLGYRIFYQQCRNFRFRSKRTGFATRHTLLQSSTPRKTQKGVIFYLAVKQFPVLHSVDCSEYGWGNERFRKLTFEFPLPRGVYNDNLCMVFLVGNIVYEYKNHRILSLFMLLLWSAHNYKNNSKKINCRNKHSMLQQ